MLAGLLLAMPMQGFSGEEDDMDHPEVPRITAEELKQLIDEEGDYVLVDSRDSMSYNQGHIKGAIIIHNHSFRNDLTVHHCSDDQASSIGLPIH